MLYFLDYHWLCNRGSTRISAMIGPKDRERKDVHWELELEYVAGGAQWRRVPVWKRASFSLSLSGFRAPERTWKDLEKLNFWNVEDDEEEVSSIGHCGSVDVHFKPAEDDDGDSTTLSSAFTWRVIEREGRFFNIELAGFADGQSLHDAFDQQPVVVATDGTEERAEPEAEFWKANAQVYLIEPVPFGTVTVRVPRNAKDPEQYALARAQALIGVNQPEHFEVTDFSKYEKSGESLHDDLYVVLHFNGRYER